MAGFSATVASLPLCGAGTWRDDGFMNGISQKIRELVREMNDAQRLLTIRRLAVDAQLPRPGSAPQNYAEFLARTSAPMLHEPSAAQRAAGRAIR
jgi:hypothetical protein